MTKQSEIKRIKSIKKPKFKQSVVRSSQSTMIKEDTQKERVRSELVKKIRKPSHPITKIRVKENFDSFYSGGEIQLIGDDQLIFSIFNQKIRVYSLQAYKVIFEIEHKNEEIYNFLTFLKNKIRYVITFTRNGMLRLVKLSQVSSSSFEFEVVEKKKLLKFLAIEMKIDTSCKYVVLADPKGEFKIVNAQTFRIIREFSLGNGYVKMRIVGQYIVFISRDRALIFYNLLTNRKVKEIKTETQTTFADFAVVSTQNKRIILSGFDNKIYYYDSKSEKISPLVELNGFVNIIETIHLLNHVDSTLCIFGYEDGRVEFGWFNPELQTLTKIETAQIFENRHQFQRILFDFPRSAIYFVTDEGEIYKTTLTATSNGGLKMDLSEEYVGLNDQVMDLKFINQNYGVVCTNSETIRIIDVQTRSSNLLSGHEDLVTCVDVFKEKYMLTGSKDGKIYLWKIIHPEGNSTEKRIVDLNTTQQTRLGISFRLIKKYKGHTGSVTTIKFAPKSGTKFVSAGSEGLIQLWDLKNKTCKSVKPHMKELNFVRISPNEKVIVTGSHDRHINFYRAKDLTLISQINAHKRGVWDADFAPLEKLLASASSDQTIKLWNYEDLSQITQVGTLEGSNAPVLKIKWIVRGLQIISGSSDGIIKLWNAKKLVCVSSFDMHEGRIWSLDVFENFVDPMLVLSGDNDNGLLLWEDCTLETQKEEAFETQENITALEHFKILIGAKNFGEALTFTFEKNMLVTFFETITRWRSEYLHFTDKIYSIDQTRPKNEGLLELAFESQLANVLKPLYQENKKVFLLMLKNFVTHSKFSGAVQLVIRILLGHQKMIEMPANQDALKNEDLDLQQIYEVYKVFTERYYNVIKRNLKSAYSFNLFLEKNKDFIN